MSSIKLEYNTEHVIISKINNKFQINTIKQWIFLTKFNRAFVLIEYPNGYVQVSIDHKFIYCQDYELTTDLDFNYRYIFPFGTSIKKVPSYPNNTLPFTGTLNGNNHTIRNINIIDCGNNGLFGFVNGGTISNLTLSNVIISEGTYSGSLIGRAYNADLLNIKIIGNLLLGGENAGCLAGYYEGNIKNVSICVDGEITATNKSLLAYYFDESAASLLES